MIRRALWYAMWSAIAAGVVVVAVVLVRSVVLSW